MIVVPRPWRADQAEALRLGRCPVDCGVCQFAYGQPARFPQEQPSESSEAVMYFL